MKEIMLTGGHVAVVDDDNFETFSRFSWYPVIGRSGVIYATKKHKQLMHKLVFCVEASQLVDHINGNGLDNRRNNLRACSKSQNTTYARKIRSTNTSGFRGVCPFRDSQTNPWRASITVGGKQNHLGLFTNPIDADKAYNNAASAYFGAFAKLNAIETKEIANDNRTTQPTAAAV